MAFHMVGIGKQGGPQLEHAFLFMLILTTFDCRSSCSKTLLHKDSPCSPILRFLILRIGLVGSPLYKSASSADGHICCITWRGAGKPDL